MVADPAGARQRVEGAAEAVQAAYSWERVADQTEALYRELCPGAAMQGGAAPA
jgi:hypothetical protein